MTGRALVLVFAFAWSLNALAAAVSADAGEATISLGFRSDGTGVYPADCSPVTQWRENEFRVVEGAGEKKYDLELVKPAPVNLVWRQPLQMQCNGGMTMAGGKLFLMCDRGGIGFSNEHVPDFLGEKLVCIDPADGKTLWSADLNHIDLVPKGDQQRLREELAFLVAWYPEVYGAHCRWYDACWQRRKDPPPPKEEHERLYAEAAAAYRKYMPDVPATLAEQRGAGKTSNASGYIQCLFENLQEKYLPEISKKRRFVKQYGYLWNAWFGQGSFVGSAMQTPVTDGKHIYMNTMYGDAFCYDLDGKLIWKKWYNYGLTRGEVITSPFLVGNLLILRGRIPKGDGYDGKRCWMAVDKRTGEIVWQTPKHGGKSYTDAAPTLHRLPIAGDASRLLDVLWCPTGQVLRVADGKELASELGCHGNGRPWAIDGDVLVICNGSSSGGHGKAQSWDKGTVAFRLVAKSEDEVVGELLWADKKGPCRLTARNGIVYGFDNSTCVALDILTGEKIAAAGIRQWSGPYGKMFRQDEPHHLTALAGRYLFALDHDGTCDVIDLGADGRTLAVAALDNLVGDRAYGKGKYDFFNEGAQPFFSGNRMFIRSYTDLYCLGDPKQKLRLSAVHR